jgi:hypothetical protein
MVTELPAQMSGLEILPLDRIAGQRAHSGKQRRRTRLRPRIILGRELQRTLAVDIDTDKIDEATLALLYLGLHERCRAWKSFDWDAMGRLYEKGFISDPVGKPKSVMLTDEGLRESERLLRKLFARQA